MPWSKSEVSNFKEGLSEEEEEKWVEIANGYLEQCEKDQETCESEAIKLANSQVGDESMQDSDKVTQDGDKQLRVDKGTIEDYRYDEDNETLTADVKIMKSQVMPYRKDGKVQYELVPPEELTADEFLNSIKSKPITDTHPASEVNFDNIGEHAKGSIHNSDPEVKGDDVVEIWTKETIYDEDLIDDIRSGQKVQVSVGRKALVEYDSGKFNGVKYDAVQRDMEFNHLAHVAQGRAGSDVEVKLDGGIMVEDEYPQGFRELIDDAKMPKYEGTETSPPWSEVDLSLQAFIQGYLEHNPDAEGPGDEAWEQWDDLTNAAREWIRNKHIDQAGSWSGENSIGWPVVNPATNNLNKNGVNAAASRTGQLDNEQIKVIVEKLQKEFEAEDKGFDIAKEENVILVDNTGDYVMKLTIGDKELELDVEDESQKEAIEEFQDEIDERLHEIKEKDDKIEDLQDSEDEVEGIPKDEVDELLQEKEDEITKSLNTKMNVMDKVRKVDDEYEKDYTKSVNELRKDFINKVKDEEVEFEGKADGYVEALYDILVERFEDQQSKPVGDNLIKTDEDTEDEKDKFDEIYEKRQNLNNITDGE